MLMPLKDVSCSVKAVIGFNLKAVDAFYSLSRMKAVLKPSESSNWRRISPSNTFFFRLIKTQGSARDRVISKVTK